MFEACSKKHCNNTVMYSDVHGYANGSKDLNPSWNHFDVILSSLNYLRDCFARVILVDCAFTLFLALLQIRHFSFLPNICSFCSRSSLPVVLSCLYYSYFHYFSPVHSLVYYWFERFFWLLCYLLPINSAPHPSIFGGVTVVYLSPLFSSACVLGVYQSPLSYRSSNSHPFFINCGVFPSKFCTSLF